MIVKELEKCVGLLFFVAHDVARELRIDEECFLASNRVGAHQWVLSDDWLATDHAVTRARGFDLFDSGVSGLKTVEATLEFWG